VDWKLEVIVVPVTDIDRAKHFYAEQVGFGVDVDNVVGDAWRNVQLTPPGSGCSIALIKGMNLMAPGTLKGLQLVVTDIQQARQALADNGVAVSPVRHVEGADWVDGPGGPWNSFVFFDDPDGNSWTVQEKPQ
jgi:catechol 2,3-dioxygenase-like lactoylglutathione lyase family enzyme